jgi:hypothetical protein
MAFGLELRRQRNPLLNPNVGHGARRQQSCRLKLEVGKFLNSGRAA